MATLVFFNRRTIEVTINLQTIVQCTIAIWGSFCNVTADPCATCGGSRYHACEKGLIAVCGSGEDPWSSCLSLRDVKEWVLMSIAWDS